MKNQTETRHSSLLKAEHVAARLGTSKSQAYAIMRRREIPVVKIGKSVRVRPEDLEAYILNNLDMGYGQAAW